MDVRKIRESVKEEEDVERKSEKMRRKQFKERGTAQEGGRIVESE